MITSDQILKLSPRDGDVFVVPQETTEAQACQLAEAIALACPGIKAMVYRGDLQRMDLAQMNAAGWYRA